MLKNLTSQIDVPINEVPNTFNTHFVGAASKYIVKTDLSLCGQYVRKHLGTNALTLTLPTVTHDLLNNVIKTMLKIRSTVET